MRWILPLLLLPLVAAGQGEQPLPDPFRPPPADTFGGGEEGATLRARVAESLALAGAALDREPADLRALRRARELLAAYGTQEELIPRARAAVRREGLPDSQLAALRGELGQLLVEQADGMNDWGFVVIWINGRQIAPQGGRGTNAEAVKLYQEAQDHLRAALRQDPKDDASCDALASALEGVLTKEGETSEEAKKLREMAVAIRLLRHGALADAAVRLDAVAETLRNEAAALELRTPEPDHAAALLLRRRALVMDFCTHTFAFDYEPALYGPLSRLADAGIVAANLTRRFTQRDGKPGSVPPHHIEASLRTQIEIVRGLRLDTTPAAGAALVAIVRGAPVEGPLALAAVDSLAGGNHAAVREQLPALLKVALHNADAEHFPATGQRLLAKLALRMGLRAALPVLVDALGGDTNIYAPLGLAAILGGFGGAAEEGPEAKALLAVALDPARDVYFRREAALALGRVAPARLSALADEPLLEVSVAAARYRIERSDAAKGRLLSALGHPHEADDAALACADLGIVEARPALETMLAAEPPHYAAEIFKAALERLGAP